MRNKLIVESKNDKIFIQALVNKLNIEFLDIESAIKLNDEDYCLLGGADPNEKKPSTLIKMLKDIKTEIFKTGIQKIGVLLDIDNELEQKRFEMVNNAINSVFNLSHKGLITKTNELVEVKVSPNYAVQFCCYFTNIEKKGNLDTLLRNISYHEKATYANCLDAWRNCLKTNGIEITDFEFDKIWLNNYIRFDTCTDKEKTHAEKNCSMHNFDKIMKKEIFNLESAYLTELKDFIKLFKQP